MRNVGPGIIISGSIVGSGELIVTTRLGAEAGFALLWLILFSCFIKVFLQIELGRYVVSSHASVLEALDRVPGPGLRLRGGRINWLNALWACMATASILQLGGILTALAAVFAMPQLGLNTIPAAVWPIGIGGLTAGLLATGRYQFVERTTVGLVCAFSGLTIIAVLCVQGTEFAVRSEELVEGLVPAVPEGGLVTAFAVLGITGVGASELIFYPYWCLEKGYARFAGTPDGSPAWRARAVGWIEVMKVDAWTSCFVYTVGTSAFYLLGAAVLKRQGIVPGNDNLHAALSQMYVAGFDEPLGIWLYAAGAAAVLFSTFFVATASNARAVADGLHVFGLRRFTGEVDRRAALRILCVGLPVFCWAMTFTESPVVLILVGGVSQAALLPFLAGGIAYLRYRRTDRGLLLGPGSTVTDGFLWLAIGSTALIGGWQLYRVLAG